MSAKELGDAYEQAAKKQWTQPIGFIHSLFEVGLDVLKRQEVRTAIPRFSEAFIREVWEMQPRLECPKTRQIPALADQQP